MRGKGDYKNGKIYKIWSLQTDKIYVGSTYGSLTNRMSIHRSEYKRWKEGARNLIYSAVLFDLVGIENCKIELIHDFPCESKSELEAEEGRVMRANKHLLVNKKIQGRTNKEYNEEYKEHQKAYYQDNKQELNIKHKEYYEQHKEHLKIIMKEYYEQHKEQLNIKNKEYQQQHKEEISIKRSQKMTCECGVIHTLSSKSKHLKTKKHQDFIKPQ